MRANGTTVPAGADLEWCEVSEFPGTPGAAYHVNRLDLAKSEFSHHLFVSAVTPGQRRGGCCERARRGSASPVRRASSAFGEGTITVAGAAKPLQTIDYPEGIGKRTTADKS